VEECVVCPEGKYSVDHAFDLAAQQAIYGASLNAAVDAGTVPGFGTETQWDTVIPGTGKVPWTDDKDYMTVAHHYTAPTRLGGISHVAHDWMNDPRAMRWVQCVCRTQSGTGAASAPQAVRVHWKCQRLLRTLTPSYADSR
jgi:hypothetical protein